MARIWNPTEDLTVTQARALIEINDNTKNVVAVIAQAAGDKTFPIVTFCTPDKTFLITVEGDTVKIQFDEEPEIRTGTAAELLAELFLLIQG